MQILLSQSLIHGDSMGIKWVNNFIEEIDWNLKCLDDDIENFKLSFKIYLKESDDITSVLSNLTHMQIGLLVIRLKCDYIICEAIEALKNNQ